MKRFWSILLIMVLLAVPFASSVSALSPGDKIGDVLYTDIVAYIDGHPIRSYNIEGNTYIVVEDLMEYGFKVTWYGSNNKLVISPEHTGKYTTTYKPTPSGGTVGKVAMSYLYTNITTWIGDEMVTSYNIGGFTCICMDDLAAHFAKDYVWDANDRTLKLTIRPATSSTKTEATTSSTKTEATTSSTKTVIYNQNGVKVTYLGYSYGTSSGNLLLKLLIENNSSQQISIYADDATTSINGYMVNGDMVSNVYPGKKLEDEFCIYKNSLNKYGIITLNDVEIGFYYKFNGKYIYSGALSVISQGINTTLEGNKSGATDKKISTSAQKEQFLTYYNKAITDFSSAVKYLGYYIKNDFSDVYKAAFFNKISDCYEALNYAYELSLQYSDFKSFLQPLQNILSMCESALNGEYSLSEMNDMFTSVSNEFDAILNDIKSRM